MPNESINRTARRRGTYVFVHVPKPGAQDWWNEGRTFARLPVVGEYFALAWDGPWYRVEAVVHCPFKADYEAEVYGVEVDQPAVMRDLNHKSFP